MKRPILAIVPLTTFSTTCSLCVSEAKSLMCVYLNFSIFLAHFTQSICMVHISRLQCTNQNWNTLVLMVWSNHATHLIPTVIRIMIVKIGLGVISSTRSIQKLIAVYMWLGRGGNILHILQVCDISFPSQMCLWWNPGYQHKPPHPSTQMKKKRNEDKPFSSKLL